MPAVYQSDMIRSLNERCSRVHTMTTLPSLPTFSTQSPLLSSRSRNLVHQVLDLSFLRERVPVAKFLVAFEPAVNRGLVGHTGITADRAKAFALD